jgi:hypothetical protein
VQSKKGLGHGSSGRAPAWQAQSPEFKFSIAKEIDRQKDRKYSEPHAVHQHDADTKAKS